MAYALGRILLIGLAIRNILGFHNGAPCSTQYTMTPSTIFHGVPQNPGPRPPPYKFEIVDSSGNPVTKYKDDTYTIRVSGVQATFRGFLMQARPASPEGYPIGHLRAGMFFHDRTWKLQGIKVQPCPGVFNDSLTHATNEDRQALEVKWKPTRNYGPILFTLTIVQNRTLFWTQWLPSAGLLFPDDDAKFGSGDAKHAGGKGSKVHAEVEAEGSTPSAPTDPETAGTADTTGEPKDEEPTTAVTKRSGKGKGATRKPKATTAAPAEVTDAAETTQEVSVTDAASASAVPAQGKKGAGTEAAPPPPPAGGVDRLPPAPAAAAASGGDETETEEKKPATRRPSKAKKGQGTTTESLVSGGDVEVSVSQPEATSKGPDDAVDGPPPAHPLAPAPSGAKAPKGGSDKLPPAAPAGAEEIGDFSSNRSIDRNQPPPAGIFPPPAGAGPAPGAPEEISETTDYCVEKPCINNGTCINVPDEERYECRCTRQWAGNQCTAPNLCVNHKCKNGAECVNADDRYTCKCAREWAGDFCDKSCPAYLCENGGTCILGGNEQYSCICAPGWTGPRCHNEIKHCESNPCENGATCVHKFNAFECKCKEGFMGDTCHRPCQDIYRSCDFWGEQEKCETQRPTTRWFDINCAHTCGQCKYDNHTVHSNLTLPPVLEPFDFILGRWTLNSTVKSRFPVDFIHNNTGGYYEELVFSVAEIPQFGPPSINFSAIATNNMNSQDVMISVGFLTVRPATVPLRTFLMTTGNDGITVVEDGVMNNTIITLNANYFAILPWVDDRAPATAKRTFSIANQYLKEDVERTGNNGQKDYFTKYYWRAEKYNSF